MSQENVEAYKRAVEAANRQDLEAMLEGETIPDAFFEVSETRDLGDRLLTFGRLRAHGMESGAPTEVPFAQLVHFTDSKATVLRTFLDPKEALEAAGLRE